jgi:hypothetical protein
MRQTRLLRELTVCWLGAAGLGGIFLLAQALTGWRSHAQWILPAVCGGIAAVVIWRRHNYREEDYGAVIATVERDNPQLRHLISAAVEQKPDAEFGGYRFLQLRVVDAVLGHPERNTWGHGLERKFEVARSLNVAALAAAMALLMLVGYGAVRSDPLLSPALVREITVTPGDTEVERGASVVISARFSRQPPAEAALVISSASGKTRRIALERNLADPVFGASVADVSEGGFYHVEFQGGKTRDYKITVFDYPALLRADAALVYPRYTHLTNKTIVDTRRVSAVEGTRLTYTLQLNKPVKRAKLAGAGESLELAVGSNSVALLSDWPLTNSVKLSLALEDADGRTNKFAEEFVLVALPKRPPQLKLISPRGDPRVSRIEELQLEGEASGDFGLLDYGAGYAVNGQDPVMIDLGHETADSKKYPFKYLVSMEKLGVKADDVVSYFIWADDNAPDGSKRRTFSDMFFAEVRPFEETFREEQSGQNDQQSQQGGGGAGAEKLQLAQMQKEIVIATWKLQQEKLATAIPRTP